MPPKRCGCNKHDTFVGNDEQKVTFGKVKGKVYKKKIVQFLIDEGFLASHATYLCNVCAKYTEDNLLHEPPPKKPRVDINDIIQQIITLDIDDVAKIAFAIGRMVSKEVFQDSVNASRMYLDDEYLAKYSIHDWITNRNAVVTAFVSGVSEQDTANPRKENELECVKAIDQIYYCRNKHFISPINFCQNIISYFLSGSKSSVNVFSAGAPAGSYSTILNWIAQHAKPNEAPSTVESDVITFLDNNQVLERKWHVQSNYKSSVSVITNIMHVYPSENSTLQHAQDLSPQCWMKFHSLGTDLDKIEQDIAKTNKVFRAYRNDFIASRISKIVQEQQTLDLGFRDFVDSVISNEETNIPHHTDAKDRYDFVNSKHPDTPPDIKIGEPCLENPCSYESVQKVLDHIWENCKNNSRKWTICGSDALPYTLGMRIIEKTILCPCGREYDSEDDFQHHNHDFQHVEIMNIPDLRKYKHLMLIPGLGHYELNMTKTMFRLLWPVALQDLAKMLGFESAKALAACESATDHHKSWQIIQIFMFSMADELLVPYCRAAMLEGSSPSVAGYFSWLQQCCNSSYKFMMQAVFTYCFALHLFRAGTRRNNSSAIQASKHKFAQLFFSLNKPIYVETYIRDSLVRVQCPPDILAFIENNESYSVSGNASKGEGGDFILEARNRRTKMFLPPGIPTEKRWLNSCRNVDKLEKIQCNMNKELHLKDPDDSYMYAYDISNEIANFRAIIRNKKYVSNPFDDEPHISLSGKVLHPDLVNIKETCKNNQEMCFQYMKKNGISVKKANPVIITLEESEKTDLKSKK